MPGTDLPYAADAEESLAYEELEVLRNQYDKEREQKHVTIQTKFNYGEYDMFAYGTARPSSTFAVYNESAVRWTGAAATIWPRPHLSNHLFLSQHGASSNHRKENCRWRE